MKIRLVLFVTLALLAFSCMEEEVNPTLEIEEQESLVWSDKFDFVFTPIVTAPVVNDSLKNIYDVTLRSGNDEVTGTLNIDAGNAFSANFVNGAVLTVEGEEFTLVSKNVAMSNGFGTFRFTFENEFGDVFNTTLNGVLGRSLNGSFTTDSSGVPSSGTIKALSQGDPFRIDIGNLDLSGLTLTPVKL